MIDQLIHSIDLGLIYGLIAISIYLTFRILKFADLTPDGSFVLGGALCCVLTKAGMHPLLALTLPFLGGAAAGLCTGFLHVKCKINEMLASILVMTMLYSVNLRIMGSPNISIFDMPNIYCANRILIDLTIIGAALLSLIVLFKSYLGLIIRAVGFNPKATKSYSIVPSKYILLTLALSNGIAALAGSILTQNQGFIDISMGFGTVITGLACLMIGESLARQRGISKTLILCVFGSVVYRILIQSALNLGSFGLQASDLKFITGLFVIAAIALPKMRIKK